MPGAKKRPCGEGDEGEREDRGGTGDVGKGQGRKPLSRRASFRAKKATFHTKNMRQGNCFDKLKQSEWLEMRTVMKGG